MSVSLLCSLYPRRGDLGAQGSTHSVEWDLPWSLRSRTLKLNCECVCLGVCCEWNAAYINRLNLTCQTLKSCCQSPRARTSRPRDDRPHTCETDLPTGRRSPTQETVVVLTSDPSTQPFSGPTLTPAGCFLSDHLESRWRYAELWHICLKTQTQRKVSTF